MLRERAPPRMHEVAAAPLHYPSQAIARIQELSTTASAASAPVSVVVEKGATLTVRQGFVKGKAKLWLLEADEVDYESNHAVLVSSLDLAIANPVMIKFKPTRAGKLFVDCSVKKYPAEWRDGAPTYSVYTFGATDSNMVHLEQQIPNSVGHLTFLMTAKDTDWQSIYISSDRRWVFFRCEISPYQ